MSTIDKTRTPQQLLSCSALIVALHTVVAGPGSMHKWDDGIERLLMVLIAASRGSRRAKQCGL